MEEKKLSDAIRTLTYDGLCGEHGVTNVVSAIYALADAIEHLAKVLEVKNA